jgi:hypothetical protein
MDISAREYNTNVDFSLCSTSIADQTARCAQGLADASDYRPIGLM